MQCNDSLTCFADYVEDLNKRRGWVGGGGGGGVVSWKATLPPLLSLAQKHNTWPL